MGVVRVIALLEFTPKGIATVTIFANDQQMQVAIGKPNGVVMRARADYEKQLRLHAKNDWAMRVLAGIDREAFAS